RLVIGPVGNAKLNQPPAGESDSRLVYVLPKPGVMDPVAQSAQSAIADFGIKAEAVRTFRKYWIGGCDDRQLRVLANKLLANDAIEQVVFGPLQLRELQFGTDYQFQLLHIAIGK